MGALVMAHGDDRGLRLPPAVAPHQVVIVPVAAGDDGRPAEAAAALAAELRAAGVRVRVDDRPGLRAGAKWHEWEAKGVPVRVDLGARELDAGALPVTRRDRLTRETVARDAVAMRVGELLGEIQRDAPRRGRRSHRGRHAARPRPLWPLCRPPRGQFRLRGRALVRRPRLRSARQGGHLAPRSAACRSSGRTPAAACIVCGRPATEEAVWGLAY